MKRRAADWAVLWCVILAAPLSSPRPLAAQPNTSTDAAIEVASADAAGLDTAVGFGGFYRLGHWTPVRVTGRREADRRRAFIIAPDDEGTATRFWELPPLEAGPDGTGFAGCVRLGRIPRQLQIGFASQSSAEQLPAEDEVVTLANLPQAVTNAQQFAVVLGESIDVQTAIRLQQRPGAEALVAAHVRPEDLPTLWFAWEGVDLLILPTADTQLIEQVHPAQWEAIVTWVRMGGRLVLSVGANANQFLTDDHPLQSLSPAPFRQVISQRETGGLENYAAMSRRATVQHIDLTDPQGRFVGLPAVVWGESVDGAILAADGRGASRVAWVIQRAHGLGIVTWVATDLDTEPLVSWEGYSRLLMKLLEASLPGKDDQPRDLDSKSVSHFGFRDLSGQLRSALDQFVGVRLVPFGLIGVMAVAFALLIGPVDYFWLGRHPSRAHWTWLTFSLMVVAAIVGIAALAHFWKGNRTRINQVTLIDFDAATGTQRGTNWTHVYLPSVTRLSGRCEVPEPLAEQGRVGERLFAWHGLAGTGFGGMDSTAAIGGSLPTYDIVWQRDEGGWFSEVERLLVPQWSSRQFSARWRVDSPPTSASSLASVPGSGLVTGQLTNPLPIPLRGTYLCYGRWLFEIGDLGPGQTALIDRSAPAFDLRSRLTRRQIMDTKQITSPWDEESLEVARIMEMIMFHDAAGGRTYTSLLHRQAGQLDFSDQLDLGRAVLVGRVATIENVMPMELGPDEPDFQTWNFCRILFEVEDTNE